MYTKAWVLNFLRGRHAAQKIVEEVEARLECVSDLRGRFPEEKIDYVLEDPQLVAGFVRGANSFLVPG